MSTTVQASGPPTPPARVRVLIADDDLDVRVLLKWWLDRHDSFDVAAEAADGVQAVDAAIRVRPHLAVLDLGMPRMDGLEAATEIRRVLPATRIVIRSGFSAERMAQKAIDAGADVYVEKGADKAQLLAVLTGLFPAIDRPAGGAPPAVEPAPAPSGTSVEDLLLDALDAGVLMVDGEGRVRSANFAATLALDVPTSRLVGSSLTDLLAGARHEDGRATGAGAPDPVTAARATSRPQSARVLQLTRPGGGSAWLSINVRPTGGAVGSAATAAVVVIDDVTELRRLRVALRDAEARLSQLAVSPGRAPSETTELLEAAVASSPVGAVLLDESARVVIANPVADRLLGDSLLLGSGPPARVVQWADTKEPVQEEDLPIRAACQGVAFDDLELFVAAGDGSGGGIYVKASGRPVLAPDGSPVGAVISVLDDTATKAAEQSLAATHRELRRSNDELANFASTASHDLAQPLQKVSGFAQLLQEELDLDDARVRDHVDRIVVGCERMSTLIQDLLAYSRITSDARAFEPVELGSVVDEVLELYEEEIADKGARVEVGALPTVLADRTQMVQLFQNLIGNALMYVAGGVPPVVRVHSTRGEGECQISVVDNGIGVSPEDRQRALGMFQRLVTADQYPGTGIGLAVCVRIAERHGGRLWIDGNPGAGSRISFTVPDRPLST